MIEHKDISYPVYHKLRKMILQGELKPGEKLLQEKLAKNLGVSRTPLLKALQMLEYDFLVESIPRRGMIVKVLTQKEMINIYDVREGIESVAIRLTTEHITKTRLKQLRSLWEPFVGNTNIDHRTYQKADEKFHSLLLEFSQNQILIRTYSKNLVEARVIQMGLQRPPEETLPEHLEMVEMISARNIDEAENLIKLHIRRSKQMIIENAMRKETELA